MHDEGSRLQVVIGLGNPGKQYAQTRHNVGYWVIDAIAQEMPTKSSDRSLASCVVTEGVWNEAGPVVLAKPATYMNQSGRAVGALISRYDLQPDQFTVVYDDLNLPLGALRLRCKGSAGGHNGVKSIIETLGTDQFQRVRIGLGGPTSPSLWHDFVLTPFDSSERETIKTSVQAAAEAIGLIWEQGFIEAMNRYNVKSKSMEE